jgi:hypothetical protein
MKRPLVLAALACLVALALAGPAFAQSSAATTLGTSSPTVSAILPTMAPNNQDTAVVISGSGFVSGATAALGTTQLSAVIVEDDTTITASVPQGMTPGTYDLTVTNPDNGSATLSGAFTVSLPPTLTSVTPSSADNDLDTTVTIAGTNFATAAGGTVPPSAKLGSTALDDVTFVNSTTLTATVPWGVDPGSYALTVTNPDGGSSTLPGAFTVGADIGSWNGSQLNGGDVRQLFMKPNDPSTLYAFAYGLHGLFRSTDAGASWTYTGGSLALDNYKVAVTPAQPDWLYAYTHWGVEVSKDGGDIWSVVSPDLWPNGKSTDNADLHVSPADADLLFVNSYVTRTRAAPQATPRA